MTDTCKKDTFQLSTDFDEIWDMLLPGELQEACLAYAGFKDSNAKEDKPKVLKRLAQLINFREKTLRGLPAEKLAEYLIKHIRHESILLFRENIVRSWLLNDHLAVITAFLDATGVPHENGMLDADDEDAPSVELFQKALSNSIQSQPERPLAVYVAYHLILGDDYWDNLREAAKLLRYNPLDILKTDASQAGADKSDQDEPIPESNRSFTTLDNLLIKTIVASAVEEVGAHSFEELDDLVNEFVDLNVTRHHSFFHRGFLHGMYGYEIQDHFTGENESRRVWYFSGVVFAQLRRSDEKDILKLLETKLELFKLLANTVEPCGPMVARHLVDILLKHDKWEMMGMLLNGQLGRMDPNQALYILNALTYEVAGCVRDEKASEAMVIIDIIASSFNEEDIMGSDFPWLWQRYLRKRAQAFQLRGDLSGAEAILNRFFKLGNSETETFASASCDYALVKAGFRSLYAVSNIPDPESAGKVFNALEQRKDLFQETIREFDDCSYNSHLCEGIRLFLKGSIHHERTIFHLTTSLKGMLEKEAAYQRLGLISFTQFVLGIAYLETCEESHFQNAEERLRGAMQAKVFFPIHLWARALEAASLFDNKSLALEIIEHVRKMRGDGAFDAIGRSSAVLSHPDLRAAYEQWILGRKIPKEELWKEFCRILPYALKDKDSSHAEAIIDRMEDLVEGESLLQRKFAEFLEDENHYAPVLSADDVELLRIRYLDRCGEVDQTLTILRSRFHRYRADREDPRAQAHAKQLLDWMKPLTRGSGEYDDLLKLVSDEGPDLEGELKGAQLVAKIIYVGGNEVQSQYEGWLKRHFAEKYPKLELEFHFPGWSSNWDEPLQLISSRLSSSDAVVLNCLVRTGFGRKLRKCCDEKTPWFPCTGRGRQSLALSISGAAQYVYSRKMGP